MADEKGKLQIEKCESKVSEENKASYEDGSIFVFAVKTKSGKCKAAIQRKGA